MEGLSWAVARAWILTTGARIALVLLLTWAGIWILRRGIARFITLQHERLGPGETAKRMETLAALLRTSGLVAVCILSGLIILSLLGVKPGPLIAALGVGGLALGFGAQNLVRDVISGFFILLEDQVRVGDVVSLNGQGGLVENVTLRHIRLRDLSGTVHYFPNGIINQVSNMTKEFSYYVVDMGVAYKEDTDRVSGIMSQVLAEMRGEDAWREKIIDDFEVLGVDRFADSAVIVRGRIKTKALAQWAVGREFNRRVKKAFDAADIEIPFPHRTLYWGTAQDPAGAPRA